MQNEPQTLEVSLEEVKEKIALGDALDTLHRSPAFKKVILGKLFDARSKELVSMAALPMSEQQETIMKNGMITISGLQRFFNSIYIDAAQARQDLGEYEAAIAEDNANVE